MTVKYLVDFTRELPSKPASTVFSLLKWTDTYLLIYPEKYCGSTWDKEFPSQHHDHGFTFAIQWFFIESAPSLLWDIIL